MTSKYSDDNFKLTKEFLINVFKNPDYKDEFKKKQHLLKSLSNINGYYINDVIIDLLYELDKNKVTYLTYERRMGLTTSLLIDIFNRWNRVIDIYKTTAILTNGNQLESIKHEFMHMVKQNTPSLVYESIVRMSSHTRVYNPTCYNSLIFVTNTNSIRGMSINTLIIDGCMNFNINDFAAIYPMLLGSNSRIIVVDNNIKSNVKEFLNNDNSIIKLHVTTKGIIHV